MVHKARRLAGACLLVFVAVTHVMAQGKLVPVMRIGHWLEVGGTHSVAWVLQAQERLKAAGIEPGAVDGALGPPARDALRQYQQRHNLPATGELDEATLKALGIQ